MKGFTTRAKQDLHDSLKMSAVKMFLSIIEGSIDKDIYKQIANSLDDFVILTKRLEFIYERFVTEDLELDIETPLEIINTSLKKDSF